VPIEKCDRLTPQVVQNISQCNDIYTYWKSWEILCCTDDTDCRMSYGNCEIRVWSDWRKEIIRSSKDCSRFMK